MKTNSTAIAVKARRKSGAENVRVRVVFISEEKLVDSFFRIWNQTAIKYLNNVPFTNEMLYIIDPENSIIHPLVNTSALFVSDK
jgi:hypothetical protein